MAIDRIDWHSGGNFPEGLPHENGGTHIGIYLAWILHNNLHGDIHRDDEHSVKAVNQVISREKTGRDFLIEQCDEKFWEEDLNEEGKSFTEYYYSNKETAKFYKDYSDYLDNDEETLYHVENTWDNYDKISPVISGRFKDWKKLKQLKPWWKFW